MIDLDVTIPFSYDALVKYFETDDARMLVNGDLLIIDAEQSLMYLSNMDVTADITFTNLQKKEEYLTAYLTTSTCVNVPSLANAVMDVLCYITLPEYSGWVPSTEFMHKNAETLQLWLKLVSSLRAYSLSVFQSDEFVSKFKEIPVDNYDCNTGSNLPWILTNPDLPMIINATLTEPVYNYTNYYESTRYKGKNLFAYWAVPENMMFLLSIMAYDSYATKGQTKDVPLI